MYILKLDLISEHEVRAYAWLCMVILGTLYDGFVRSSGWKVLNFERNQAQWY